MTSRVYKSTDGSAPVLTGQVGSLIALLDAVLVNGYGALAAAGWTKPFAGTNTAVYRNSTVTGTGFYLDVNDNAPGAGAARESRMRGYETMSAIATGTGLFPTVAQFTDGLFCRKSQTADATARPWVILADETVFYLFTETNDIAVPPTAFTFCFGDFISYKSNDPYRCMVIGRVGENSASGGNDCLAKIVNASGASAWVTTASAGNYLARIAAGTGTSVNFGKFLPAPISSGSIGLTGLTYPSPISNGLYMSRVIVAHGGDVRGYLKGVWGPLHPLPLANGDTFSGVGSLAGKAFLARHIADGTGSQTGQIILETSNTWS